MRLRVNPPILVSNLINLSKLPKEKVWIANNSTTGRVYKKICHKGTEYQKSDYILLGKCAQTNDFIGKKEFLKKN